MIKAVGRKLLRRYPTLAAARENLTMAWPVIIGRRARGARVWSQFGEDERLVQELRNSIQDGYYIDVGANHPAHGSNTYRLYSLGMRGVCVEPNDMLCALHRRYRPEDILLNAAIGPTNGILKFYEFACHALSTFSQEEADSHIAKKTELLRVSLKPVVRLQTIIEQCVPPGRTKLELLTIDTEGWDEVVLRSHDWQSTRPRFVVAECNTPQAKESITGLMRDLNYAVDGTFGVNTLFRDLGR